MEILRLNNKENIINSYGVKPTLPYDVEGVLVEKKGKDIKIEKTIDNKTVEYSLRLKEEIVSSLGENIKIEKENIISAKIEEKEEAVKEEVEVRKVADIIRELGLEYTEENIRMIEYLLSSGISITKDNINSYIKSKEYLNKIIEGIDTDLFVRLMDRGIDIEGESLQKLAQVLEEVKNEKMPFSLKKFLRLEKDLTYKEAEEIAKEIYGQKMGKDVYDTIIALHKGKIPITRENIDKTVEIMSKLHNLKGIKDETYVKILNQEKPFNIDNLYKLNNSYTLNTIENNIGAKKFEGFTIGKETTIDGLKEILANLDIEDNMENLNILREFVVQEMVMDRENYKQIISMKQAVRELIVLLDQTEITNLNGKSIDPLKEDIYKLVEELKKKSMSEEIEESLNPEKTEEIMRELETLGSIKDKDLLQLIKKGEEFTLKSIKEITATNMHKGLSIEYKILDKTICISNILNSLGENLSYNTISLTSNRYNDITLENLYITQEEINANQEGIEPVNRIGEAFIYEEYIKARNSLTVNMIRESIKDGKILEQMPINELNNYIEKKINRYKESYKGVKEIKDIKGKEERIIPIIMKNGISMSLREIKDINSFLNGEKGLTNILEDMADANNLKYNEEFKEGIRLLQERMSTSIKNGEDIKDSYKELMSLLNSSNSSFREKDKDSDNRKQDEYISIQGKISQRDIVFQIPIQINKEYRNLNIIVPDGNQGIDKNNMKFFLGLDTDNLGIINMDIDVKGKEIQINIEEQGSYLTKRIAILEEGLENLGYTLKKEKKSVIR